MSGFKEQVEARYEKAGIDPRGASLFLRAYNRWRGVEERTIPWEEFQPPLPGELKSYSDLLGYGDEGVGRYDELVWIILNGGLGTSMEVSHAKSLLKVKGEETFLDLILGFIGKIAGETGVEIPLILMNSPATRDDSLAALERYGDERANKTLPEDFLQNFFPRVVERDGSLYGAPEDEESWAPPGHGDLYEAIYGSGVLDKLLAAGKRWAFISNADNLGASPSPQLLGYMSSSSIPFIMEVTERTKADVKGGTLVKRGGSLNLLEIAQVADERVGEFQDIDRFKVFNTNNLWIDLRALKDRMEVGGLELPLIVNRKVVDGVGILQLESAMGAAISSFEGAEGVVVPRGRFAPVKTTSDLLVRRSDIYVKGETSPLEVNRERSQALGVPVVSLDPRFYKSVESMEMRIPSAPSLINAKALTIKGDVRFEPGVKVIGEVIVENLKSDPLLVLSGTVLEG